MQVEQMEKVNDFCDFADEDLGRLKDRVEKIIAAKKNLSGDSKKDSTVVQKALANLENLEKIDQKLSGSIKEIQELCNKMHLLLVPQPVKAEDVSPEEPPENASATVEKEEKK